jgi:hypothetical protein
VITADISDRPYSTRLRTAVVLTGSGTAGAYHAGVLRALHEAGIRIDLVAGRGIGAATAMFAAVDGGARLWEPSGLWKGGRAARFYAWRAGLRAAAAALLCAAATMLFPVVLFAWAIAIGTIGFVLTLVGLEAAGSAWTVSFTSRLAALFAPGSLPTSVPRLVLFFILLALAALVITIGGRYAAERRRRTRRGIVQVLWELVGHPLTAGRTCGAFAAELWHLIKGVAPLQRPRDTELGRRYVELLAENLGQPGFRELLVVVHDLDARQDLVFAFLAEPHRQRFFSSPAAGGGLRPAEAFDLAGIARDHAMDALAAAAALPLATEPHLVTFAAEGPWRGETHRVCDRPGALARVLEEVAAAGAEQVVLLSAAPRAARPHELSTRRRDPRGAGGEQLAAFETAGLRDVVEQYAARFAGLYVIRPEHNPLGPLDFGGSHDERSDRRYTLAELVDRGYEDAYRQFIDPVVGSV